MARARPSPVEWSRPIVLLLVFSLVGIVVWRIRAQVYYLALFVSMGFIGGLTEHSLMRWPRYRQRIRLGTQILVGGGLLIGLSLVLAVNFQFSQIFFDATAGVVTGALIQLVIARIVAPLVFGNAFCSRACWDGPFFELIPGRAPGGKPPRPRSEAIAWLYLALLVALTLLLSHWWNPATNGVDLTTNAPQRRYWALGENVLIVVGGILLVPLWGRRAYCRMLCPFFTISRLLARYSVYKIASVQPDACIGCNRCNDGCPMLVDVRGAVSKRQRVLNRDCILCERCVDSCDQDCLQLRPGLPWR